MKNHSFWLTFVLVCVGIVVGTLAGMAAEQISWLSWLNFGLNFGMSTPLILDLKVISITFAATLNLNISVIIFVGLALILGRLIVLK